jgi:hypothetical protein
MELDTFETDTTYYIIYNRLCPNDYPLDDFENIELVNNTFTLDNDTNKIKFKIINVSTEY